MARGKSDKQALYVPQGFAVYTRGSDGASAVLIEGMGPCNWVTVHSTAPSAPFLAATHADLDTDIGAFILDAIRSGNLGRNFKVQMGSKKKFEGDEVHLIDIYKRKVTDALEGLGMSAAEQGNVFSIDNRDSASILIRLDGGIITSSQSVYLYLQDVREDKFSPSTLRSSYANELYAERLSFMAEYRSVCASDGKEARGFPWKPVVVWNDLDVGKVASVEIYGQILSQVKSAVKECPKAMGAYLECGGTLLNEEYQGLKVEYLRLKKADPQLLKSKRTCITRAPARSGALPKCVSEDDAQDLDGEGVGGVASVAAHQLPRIAGRFLSSGDAAKSGVASRRLYPRPEVEQGAVHTKRVLDAREGAVSLPSLPRR